MHLSLDALVNIDLYAAHIDSISYMLYSQKSTLKRLDIDAVHNVATNRCREGARMADIARPPIIFIPPQFFQFHVFPAEEEKNH